MPKCCGALESNQLEHVNPMQISATVTASEDNRTGRLDVRCGGGGKILNALGSYNRFANSRVRVV